MSRAYEMTAEITGFNPRRKKQIINACRGEWDFDNVEEYTKGELTLWGNDMLTGGEGDDEFAKRLVAAVWEANCAGCHVNVRATYMENLPYTEHTFTKSQYRKPRKRR